MLLGWTGVAVLSHRRAERYRWRRGRESAGLESASMVGSGEHRSWSVPAAAGARGSVGCLMFDGVVCAAVDLTRVFVSTDPAGGAQTWSGASLGPQLVANGLDTEGLRAVVLRISRLVCRGRRRVRSLLLESHGRSERVDGGAAERQLGCGRLSVCESLRRGQ
jgi:hypothetical protein